MYPGVNLRFKFGPKNAINNTREHYLFYIILKHTLVTMKATNIFLFLSSLVITATTTIASTTTSCAFVDVVPGRSSYCSRTSSKQSLFAETTSLEAMLSSKYPTFFDAVLKRNEELWKKLKDPSVQSYTIFCPSEIAMRNLGDKKILQLQDDRNTETTTKIGLYHVVLNEAVRADQLFDSAGVIPMAGDGAVVPVERSVSGGFFGVGGKEDGGTTVGGAKVTATIKVSDDSSSGGLVHEVDDLVSPNILWRYMDQLRIPGTK